MLGSSGQKVPGLPREVVVFKERLDMVLNAMV